MMNKKVRIISITVALVLMLTVVVGLDQGGALAAETRTIIDQRGKVVVIPKEVNRIVTICVPFPAAIYAVTGSGEKIVGMNPFSMSAVNESILGVLAPELKKASTGFITGGFEVNIEELLKLKPDVVFQWSRKDKEIEKMEAVGIPVIGISAGGRDPRNVKGWMKIIAEVIGGEAKQRAFDLIAYLDETLEMISSRTSSILKEKRPKALILANVESLGVGPYIWIELVGAVNVAEEIPRVGGMAGSCVNIEQIYKWDPDIIYIGNFCETQPEDILKNKIEGQDWSPIEAVKNRRVYKVPLGTYRWDPPSAESALMLKWLAQKHYPELFADYSIEEEVREFYLRFFHYEISDEEIEKIFHPAHTGVWK